MQRLLLATALFCLANPALAETGIASIYANGDGHEWSQTAHCWRQGKTVCERVNPALMTAAHRTLPIGTMVVIAYKDHEALVRINDRGPYKHGRIIDVTPAVAHALHFDGLGRVTVTVLR